MVKPNCLCSRLICERSTHFISGSMTVSGSSNRMALTSLRTRPRPSEIFCFWSAVSPRAVFFAQPPRPIISIVSLTRRSTSASGTCRLRKGKARLS
ncbi:hypothetical protein D9M70_550210 [compost metagenome]